MSSLLAFRALLLAGEMFAGSTAIVILAWLASLRSRASVRHLVWAGAFGALLALPLLVAIIPSPLRILLAAAPDYPPVQAIGQMPPAAQDLNVSSFNFDPGTIVLLLLALWLVGAVSVLSRWAIAAGYLATLRRKSRVFAIAPEALPKVASKGRECEVRLAVSDTGPITWGTFRPVILLPRSAVSWPCERLQAVLLHELAHIRRRDSFVQTTSLVACALYWCNPLVWLAARELRREAELAADDAALLAGVKPSNYAGQLLALANEFRSRRAAPAMALFMASPSALEARVQSVLNSSNLRTGVTSMDIIKVAGIGICTASMLALACPSLAQDVSQQPLPPASPAAPDVPPAPDAPPAPSAPPTPPAPSVDYASPHEALIIDEHGMHHLSAADRKRIHAAVEKAMREAREAIERSRPEIDRAIANAHVAEQSVRAAQPQIDAAMEEARKAQPQIDAAMEEVRKAQPEIDRAIQSARPQIDAALAKVRVELAKEHLDANIKMRVDEALKRAEIRIEAADARVKAHQSSREERSDDRETPDDN